eukprot:jgi/Tetstr1/454275/TSEL_041194.t1
MGAREVPVHAMDALARLMFLETPDTASLQISMPPSCNSRELFLLLLDLAIRGLLLLFAGSESGASGARDRIAVHDITGEQFATLARKMRAAGVLFRRTAVDDPSACAATTNLGAIMTGPADLPLERYRLEARTHGRVYVMWFTAVHNVRPGDMTCGGPLERR